jgi:hypothetical protein
MARWHPWVRPAIRGLSCQLFGGLFFLRQSVFAPRIQGDHEFSRSQFVVALNSWDQLVLLAVRRFAIQSDVESLKSPCTIAEIQNRRRQGEEYRLN